jgi:hypothetical protein
VCGASAGAADAIRRRRHLASGVCAVAVAFVAGCADRAERPSTLVDGSPATPPPAELEGVSELAVATKIRVRRAAALPADGQAASCVRAHDPAAPDGRDGVIVERVGVESSSVTFGSASGLHGCDGSKGTREAGRRWCGIAFGVVKSGRLDDPRLDVTGCRTASGAPLGFVWVYAGPRTRYVAVRQDGYVEVYEPASGTPIRIATATGVEVDGSRATFRISEHDARGHLLRRYELDAVPAG